ncbi:helix-turn-helix domain-containing protein [Metapseudomonas boanensis]|uniref:Helix-turn-helix domain-containing protein n=1 Tax=Metapseudomonas boanensis TaxID=2822138 RepID=A0ABS5XGY7_9GAMM|nr:helix-turn-helix domain-containing protein [Pseudomonas boanensis]MBT8766295.1 helix-turn-helix domain-containing protein [Pseudomonas boanensis]
MNTTHSANIAAIKSEIAAQLGYDPKNPPVNVDDKQAATALGLQPTTLAVWRSTGRYNLPFLKVGRLVKYRLSDLAEFLARRTATHTGVVHSE